MSSGIVYDKVLGCKWSRQIVRLIDTGVVRPGAITSAVDGLTTKVQTDCLKRMTALGIVNRTEFSEIPPRVEYELTDIGEKFIGILNAVEALQKDIDKRWKR